MEIFRLFGSILVDNEEANQSISSTAKSAEGLSGKLSAGIAVAAELGAGIALAAGAAAVALGTMAVNAAEDFHKALNGLQAATGTSIEKMSGMRDAMLDIYNNNFGSSFEDIGLAMQTIAQQTKLSGDALATTTKNALAIRDTFGIEVTESIRSVNQLIKNFGLDADMAYNLMAQGAQNGLNANENLADSINEYSVHFAQIGLSAQDMFNMMVNGAASGVFDIDKLGDAIKEFGIRVKDMSTGTMTAFTSLGLDADKISNDFAAGGTRAKAAFDLVTTNLNAMKDPLAQTSTGTALFGTMWEDIGAKGVAALTNVNGKVSESTNALNQINAVKYNTFGEAVDGIKRQLETSILIPLGEKILPILNKFAGWISENMPIIKQYIGIAMDEVAKAFDMVYNVINGDVNPVFNQLAEILRYYVQEYIPLFVSAFQEWVPQIFAIFKQVWDLLSPLLAQWLVSFNYIFPTIKDIISNAIRTITGVVSGFLTTLEGILTFINGVFSGNWDKAWQGIKLIFEGQFKAMSSVVKGVLNEVIALVNTMVRGLNRVNFSFPSWVPGMGGKSFSLSIPEIPMLAKGGNILDGGATIVGENGPELLENIKGARVTPLDKAGGITIYITGNSIMSDSDADKLGDLLVGRLKMLGVT